MVFGQAQAPERGAEGQEEKAVEKKKQTKKNVLRNPHHNLPENLLNT